MSEYVIARTRGGLCNRIKCLISSQRIARKYSKELLLSWPVDEDCGCRFSDLFDNKIAEVSQEDSLRLSRERAYQVCDSWRLLTLPEENLGPKFSRAYVSREGNNIDFEYERIPLGVREDVLKYVRKLTPINDIIEKVGEFREKFDRASVSVNIRSWPGEDRSVFFNIRKLYKVLDREKAGSFFVVSDSAEVLGQIKKRYGARVLTYPRRTFPGDRKSREGIQDALIELLLLAENKSLKASYLSTFSEMAWWFGGCRARVEVIPITFSGRLSIFSERIKMAIKRSAEQGDKSAADRGDKNG